MKTTSLVPTLEPLQLVDLGVSSRGSAFTLLSGSITPGGLAARAASDAFFAEWTPTVLDFAPAPLAAPAPMVSRAPAPRQAAAPTPSLATLRPSGDPGSVNALEDSSSGEIAANGEATLLQAQVDALEAGFGSTLTGLQTDLVAQVFAENLPVLGDNLAEVSGSAAELQFITTLKTAIVEGLGTLTGAAEYSETQVEDAINAMLTAAGITGTGATVDFSNPTNSVLTFATAKSFAAFAVPVDADLGLPNLDVRTSGNAQTTVAWQFDFGAGLQGADFYLETGAGSSAFQVTTETKLPSFTQSGTLSGLPVTATDQGTDFDGVFTVTLKDPNSDGKLTVAELANAPDLLDATLAGGVDVRLNLATTLPGTSGLPKLGTDLRIDWDFTATNGVVDPGDLNADFGGLPAVSFTNNRVDLGSFFDGFAGRVLNQIGSVTSPMQEVISFLTAPIPLLSEIGSSDLTLLDIADLSPEEVSAIKGLGDIAELADLVAGFGGNQGVLINLGSLNLSGDLRSDVLDDVLVSLGSAVNLSGQSADLSQFLNAVQALNGDLKFELLTDPLAIGKLFVGQDVDLFEYRPDPFAFEFEYSQYIPIFGVAGMTLGGALGLSAEFDFGFDTQGVRDFVASGDANSLFNGFFVRGFDDGDPVTNLGLSVGIQAGVEVNIGIANVGVDGDLTAEITFGFDRSLDPDGDGKIRGNTLISTPLGDLFDPTGKVTTGLHAYAEVDLGIFSVGIEIDSPRVTLLDFDGDSDGPVLASQGAGDALLLNVGARSPLRIYGNLTDRAESYRIVNNLFQGDPVGLLIEAFDTEKVYDYPERIVADGGEHGDRLELADDVDVPVTFSGGLSRDFLTGGAMDDFLNGDAGPDVLNGNGGADRLNGGPGSDLLIGGSGGDVLDGGDPGDIDPLPIDTASYVTAAEGMTLDLLNGILTGDAAGDTFISIEGYEGTNFSDTIRGTDGSNPRLHGLLGNDTIEGLLGNDVLNGGEGDDSLVGGGNDDLLTGGPGADRLVGGAGADTASYLESKTPVTVDLATGTGTRGDAQGDVLSEVEILIGSPLPFGTDPFPPHPFAPPLGDELYGDDFANVLSGLAGGDLLEGRGGNDLLYGDYVGASPSGQEVDPGHNRDRLNGGSGEDQLFGQSGDDELDGGTGNDLLEGGPGVDLVQMLDVAGIDHADGGTEFDALSADFSTQTVDIIWDDRTPTPFLFADGRSAVNFETLKEIRTGSGNDSIRLTGPYSASSYSSFLFNTIFTGTGNDVIYSGAKADFVDAGEGDDFVHGGGVVFAEALPTETPYPRFNSFTNVVEGISGNTLHGGLGVDTVSFEGEDFYIQGGTAASYGVAVNLATNETGRAATGTTISGFENVIGTDAKDELIGDGGPNVFTPLRGGGGLVPFVGGPDFIDGTAGEDTLIIDFSRSDLPALRGAVFSGNTINRASDSPSVGGDGYNYNRIERIQITGASKGDLIYSNFVDGADTLLGLGDNDTLGGNGGADTLIGGEGNDILTAQGTFQPSYGGTAGGHDVIEGGAGDDLIEDIASFSTPTLTADARFHLDGGTGFDTLSANFSNQPAIVWTSAAPTNVEFEDLAYFRNFEQLRYFITGSGDDSITQLGRVNNDFRLGAGDDTVNPGLGVDANVDGGAGNDLAILDFSVLDTPDLAGVTTSFISGGGGQYQRALVSNSSSRPDQIFVSNFERVQVTGTTKGDVIYGTWGTDTLIGGGGNDTLNANEGGNDSLDGGDGDDVLTGNSANRGAGGNDTILGGAGNDTISPGLGNDSVIGGAGNDVISETSAVSNGFGVDFIDAGDGDDTVVNMYFTGFYSYATATTRMKLEGGAGFDQLSADFGDKTQAITFVGGQSNSVEFSDGSYFRNFEQLNNFNSGSGHDLLTLPGRRNNTLGLGAGNDTLNPGLGIDDVYGNAGDDLLVLDYSLGDDPTLGGVTTVSFSIRRSELLTGTIVDSVNRDDFDRFNITGGSKADSLVGGGSTDTLSGGAGNDTLNAGGASDVVDVGRGNDTTDGGTGSDLLKLDWSGLTTGAQGARYTSLNATTGTGVLATSDAAFKVTFANFERYDLRGSELDDVLQGGNLGDNLRGGAGDDTLDAGRGSDTTDGGTGNDVLKLDWSAMTTGAQGARYSSFNAATGTGALATSDAAGYTLAFASFERVDLTGTGLADDLRGFDLADNLRGGLGNDTLSGGAGADSLDGGDGNDTFDSGNGDDFLKGGAGVDVLDGGAGNDRFDVSEEGGQWAGSVIAFSSQYPGPYTATKALGAPNTFNYGDSTNAWSPSTSAGSPEFLTLGFANPVQATGVTVRENLGNGFVSRIDLIDTAGLSHVVFEGIDPSQPGAVVDFTIIFPQTDYLVAAVKVHVDTNRGSGYEEIDAVQLRSPSGGSGETVVGGPGLDTLVINLALDPTPKTIVNTPVLPNGGTHSGIESFVLTTGAGADSITFTTAYDQTISSGAGHDRITTGGGQDTLRGDDGNDTLNGGAGADSMSGGAGDDTYSIDSIADIISENANEGTDTVNAIISYTLGANMENLVLGGTALNGTGNALANILTGNAKNNLLSGGDGDDALMGGLGIGLASREVDRLAGGPGADTFLLGDATNGRYYDDRSSLSAGKTGYARIEDFTPSQGDKFQLKGSAAEYYLGASGVSGVPGQGLFHDTNGNGVSSLDELIAILDSAETLTPANTINAAVFL